MTSIKSEGMMKQYKSTKSMDELIRYLYTNKKIRFNVISEEEAKVILWKNNYVNVVTPF